LLNFSDLFKAKEKSGLPLRPPNLQSSNQPFKKEKMISKASKKVPDFNAMNQSKVNKEGEARQRLI